MVRFAGAHLGWAIVNSPLRRLASSTHTQTRGVFRLDRQNALDFVGQYLR